MCAFVGGLFFNVVLDNSLFFTNFGQKIGGGDGGRGGGRAIIFFLQP